MIKKWSVKVLYLGLLVILLLSLRSWLFNLSINNEKEHLASVEEKNDEEKLIVLEAVKSDEEEIVVSESEKNNEEVLVVSAAEKNDKEEIVVSEPEKNNEAEPVVSEPEKSNEEISNKEITSKEAIDVIRKAYLNSICIFNRDVDRSQYIDEGIYCRPQDKQLSYNTILTTLKSYYTESFLEKGNIADKALKIHEGKLYVLLLEGQYDYNSSFEVMSISSTEDTAEVRVKLITEYDTIESEVTLKQEEGTWKVEDGVIFPQLP